jgi:hypothetical protein
MLQRLPRTESFIWIEIHDSCQKFDRLCFTGPQLITLLLSATSPDDDLLKTKSLIADGFDGGFEDLAVHGGYGLHFLPAEDAGHFDHGVDVICAVEEGESAGQEGEQDDAGGPDVDFCGLIGAF